MTSPSSADGRDRSLESGRAQNYVAQLDGVRALAALAVVLYHLRGNWLPGGYIGVDVFFVLSGYLISRILLAERMKTGRVSLRSFYARRALRLFPALVVVCAVVGLVFWIDPLLAQRQETLRGAVAALTYTSTWMMAFGLSDLGAMVSTWSLAVEEYFYLVWPLLLLLCCRAGRYARILVLSLLGAGIAYRLLVDFALHWPLARMYYAPDTRAEQLIVGCALAFVLPALATRISAVWAVGAAALLVSFLFLGARMSAEIYHSGGSTVVALLTAVILAHIVTTETGWISRTLSVRPMVWIGQRSYGIYLWHAPLFVMFGFLGYSGFAAPAIRLGLAFAVPALSFWLVEKPFLRLKGRFERTATEVVRDDGG